MSLLVFDQGQSQTRVRYIDPAESIVVDQVLAGRERRETLNEALISIAAKSSELFGGRKFSSIVGGSTGIFGQKQNLTDAAQRLYRDFGTRRVVVADDCLTGYLGALGESAGVVVAAGTGVVALGLNAEGDHARVDGYGAMLGDEGSGWWIGRQGLISAFSFADGRRGGSEALWNAATRHFGTLANVPSAVSRSASPNFLVSSFALPVAEAARAGDEKARSIWAEAGRHLAQCVIAASTRANLGSAFALCMTGRIGLAADLFARDFDDALAQAGLNPLRADPKGSPLDGAQLLAEMPSAARSAFDSLVSEHNI